MSDFLHNFHLLRPLWLLAIIPAAWLLLRQWRNATGGQDWRSEIAAELLPHLLSGQQTPLQRRTLFALGLGWLLAALALSGPSWQQLPQPVQRKEDALVLLLDLSLSMLAQDVAPSRMVRSQQKLQDLLRQRSEGTTALVAYAGDAHVVSPLTDDRRTIANLLPALQPQIMPVPGSNPVSAVRAGIELLRDAGMLRGRLLLLSDGVSAAAVDDIDELLSGTGYQLSVLGVGTPEGSPIPLSDGFLKDSQGNIIVPGLDRHTLQQLAERGGGAYRDLSLDDQDLQQLLSSAALNDFAVDSDDGRSVDRWEDMGFWLLPVLALIASLSFRRGWLLVLVLLLPQPQRASAFELQDLWRTPDQQASELLAQGQAEAAARRFENPDWAAAANYKAEDYDAALDHYERGNGADDWYNRANALARSGEYEAAIEAYDQALQRQPEMEDATFNKELLEQLQQQQQDQQDQQQNQDQDQDQQQDQSDQNQQNQNPQDSQQQDQNSQDSKQQQQESEAQQKAEQEAQEQADAEQQAQAKPEQGQQSPQQTAAEAAADKEREQANEQWLRRIPDDPAGLLRRKFRYESQQRADQRSTSDEPGW